MGRIALDAEEKESHPSFWAGAAPHSHRCLNAQRLRTWKTNDRIIEGFHSPHRRDFTSPLDQ